MRDLSKARHDRRPDADGTSAEENRQLTDLLLQNKVSERPTVPVDADVARRPLHVLARLKTAAFLFFALPLSMIAYFSAKTAEDDFYA